MGTTAAVSGAAWKALSGRAQTAMGGAEQTRVILVLACILGLAGADTATVGASATELRHGLHISNTDIGLLVSVTSLVAAIATLPFGVLADRVRRTWTLAGAVLFWAAAMIWSAAASDFTQLLWSRLFLGAVTAAAGPVIASLVGDYFPASNRGRVYGYILAGELVGAGFGFAVTGDIATASWRAAFVVLALPAIVLAWLTFRLPEPPRADDLRSEAEPDDEPWAEPAPAPHATDVQQLVHEAGVEPHPQLVLRGDLRRLNLFSATRYVLRVRTNVILILASACGYYFLAGVLTFGIEFTTEQYNIGQAVANLLLLVIGAGAILGVLAGGYAGDSLVRHGRVDGRILVSAVTASAATVLFFPAIFTRAAGSALLYLSAAAFCLSAQNPPLDAARLDIMPPQLWGRAEAIRTLLRSLAQALAPLLFGAVSDYVFGGGRSGLQWTFAFMLLPLAGSAFLLFKARRTYPTDVATAAATVASARRRRPAPVDN
jgi:predicted MFS family arabinose efflux permease